LGLRVSSRAGSDRARTVPRPWNFNEPASQGEGEQTDIGALAVELLFATFEGVRTKTLPTRCVTAEAAAAKRVADGGSFPSLNGVGAGLSRLGVLRGERSRGTDCADNFALEGNWHTTFRSHDPKAQDPEADPTSS
jgi:hypothetical protein